MKKFKIKTEDSKNNKIIIETQGFYHSFAEVNLFEERYLWSNISQLSDSYLLDKFELIKKK